jgi:hypothetical protein
MPARNSAIHKRSDHALAIPAKHCPESLVTSQSERGMQRNQVAVTSKVVRKESCLLETRAIQTSNLQRQIHHLIVCEIERVAEQHGRLLQRTSAKKHGIPADMQIAASSFSTDLNAFDPLMRHPKVSLQDREFLRYTIQAVGFVLGMRTARCAGLGSVRRQVREVAEILANAIEQRHPPSGRAQLCFSSLFPV